MVLLLWCVICGTVHVVYGVVAVVCSVWRCCCGAVVVVLLLLCVVCGVSLKSLYNI